MKEVIQKLHELGLDLRRSYDTDYNASDDLDEIPEESELSEDAED